jgi:beta-phosphoglucomutase-like phosphatase (HAD superfamily)
LKDLELKITKDTILFFDMDGTLIDTDFANYLSFKNAIQKVLKPNKDVQFNPNERFNRTILKREFPSLGDTVYEDIIRLKETLYSENLAHTKLISFANDILTQYSKSNTTVLVTNCREERAIMTLNQHDLTNKFTHKFFRKSSDNDFHINKFENALTGLKLNPQTVIAFENEAFEIEEAIKAGIPNENIISV